jgi:hypothetical protein
MLKVPDREEKVINNALPRFMGDPGADLNWGVARFPEGGS